MKNKGFIITVLFLLSVLISGQNMIAQEKTQEEKEKEAKLQLAIEQQKKAMAEQKKVMEVQAKEQEKALQELEVVGSRSDANLSRIGRMRSTGGGWDNFEPSVYVTGPEFSNGMFFGRGGGDGERTTWDFSKNVKESTFSKQYSFDVEKTVGTVVMSVMGDCKAGEIRVKIVMPGGKTYSDILLDEFGNLNWRKSFTITDTENKDKAGEWQFKIDASKATGYFKISLQTY